jgi:transcriptional regulator with XRE-family HTH domain
MNIQKNTKTRQVGAEVLKRERKYKSVSQSELARRLGVSQPLVSSWESGRIKLGIEDAVAIELALDLEPGWVLITISHQEADRNQQPNP